MLRLKAAAAGLRPTLLLLLLLWSDPLCCKPTTCCYLVLQKLSNKINMNLMEALNVDLNGACSSTHFTKFARK